LQAFIDHPVNSIAAASANTYDFDVGKGFELIGWIDNCVHLFYYSSSIAIINLSQTFKFQPEISMIYRTIFPIPARFETLRFTITEPAMIRVVAAVTNF
jgi:hypothetical protein